MDSFGVKETRQLSSGEEDIPYYSTTPDGSLDFRLKHVPRGLIPFADLPYTHTISPGSWPRRQFQRPPFSQRPSRPIQPRRCQEFIETPPGWVPAARLAPPITLVPGCRTISAARQRSWATAAACWWTGDSTTAAGKILQSGDFPPLSLHRRLHKRGAGVNNGLDRPFGAWRAPQTSQPPHRIDPKEMGAKRQTPSG